MAGGIEKTAHDCGPGPVHSRANQHFDSLQIHTSRFHPIMQDDLQQALYFACDFVTDRLGRFFSSGLSVSSTGRARQIFSLVDTSSRLSS
jgi:hypothetical protein